MMEMVYHPEVKQEIYDLAEVFLLEDPRLAARFHESLADHMEIIRNRPEMFRERIPKVRRVNLAPRFHEYFLAYMVWNQRIVILAVGHGKRRPHYFRHRVAEARRIF